MAKPCGVPTRSRLCEEPKDKEMGDGFCTDHCNEWRRSAEFSDAMADDNVRFWAGLPSMLIKALRPFKKKWLKRMENAANGEEP